MKTALVNIYQKMRGHVIEGQVNAVSVSRFFLFSFLLTFPFQIRTLIFDENFFTDGGFNIYQSGFLYIGDLFLVISLLFYGLASLRGEIKKGKIGDKWMNVFLLLVIAVMASGIFFAEASGVAMANMIRVVFMGVAYFLLCTGVVKRKEIVIYVAIGVLIQGVIGIAQFVFQSSIGLNFIGESLIGSDIKGVAKIDVGGGKLIRSYGTFSHPNVLAGFFIVSMWMMLSEIKKKKWMIPLLVILSMAIVFTFSRSAFIALIGGGLTYFAVVQRKIDWKYPLLIISVFALVLMAFDLNGTVLQRVVTSDSSISERVEYMGISKRMAFEYPLGVGVGNFTVKMQDFTATKLAPWEFQPVHSVYLLVLNELGFIGFCLYLGIFVLILSRLFYVERIEKSDQKDWAYLLIACTISIMIISLFDHYFWTLYAGQIIFVIYLSLASSFLRMVKFPDKKS